MKTYLASRSPRRRELLDQIALAYSCIDVEINEDWSTDESPTDYVARLALEKARAGLAKIQMENELVQVIGADTSVVLDGVILGKAETADQASAMLKQLSGRSHHVLTGVALVNERELVRVNRNRVIFRPLTSDEIAHYVATGEPLGKAGGYAVQGIAAQFIERIEGSYSGVMGLPLFDLSQLLAA